MQFNTYYVYYNLHRKVFSCKNNKTKRVNKDMYTNTILMNNCVFKVSEVGRQRVLREKRKNVHAGVTGNILLYNFDTSKINLDEYTELTYNPYSYSSFVVKDTGNKILEASEVILINRRIYVKGVKK